MLSRVARAAQRRLAPSPVAARHIEYSMLYSEDDSVSRPNEHLLDISIEAIRCARQISLVDVSKRLGGRFSYEDGLVDLWPGEHYRLLSAFVQTLQPRQIIEIGTGEGLSALSMLKYLAHDAQIITFDVVPWNKYPNSCLVPDDFASGRLKQVTGDLGLRRTFQEHEELLKTADLVFVDAAKDGLFEARFISEFEKLEFSAAPIVIFDDIRLWNMLPVWRQLTWPKLDLTSFGHWCGTGISELPRHSV